MVCISGVPLTGIAALSALARQFALGDREFVALASLNDKLGTIFFPNDTRKSCTGNDRVAVRRERPAQGEQEPRAFAVRPDSGSVLQGKS